jgi:hypothetical protein
VRRAVHGTTLGRAVLLREVQDAERAPGAPSRAPITLRRIAAKRYVILCPGCGELRAVSRSDAVVCSARCRVTVSRRPGLLAEAEEMRESDGYAPPLWVKVRAYRELLPQAVRAATDVEWYRDPRAFLGHPRYADRLSDEATEEVMRAFLARDGRRGG